MGIGRRMRRTRIERGKSKKMLGNILGCSQQMIAQYENEKRTPKYETVVRFAEALDVDIDYLIDAPFSFKEPDGSISLGGSLSADDDSNVTLPLKRNLEKIYNELTPEGKRKITEYAKDIRKIPEYVKEED